LTEARAQEIRAVALEEGYPDKFIYVRPVAGYLKSGISRTEVPAGDEWYFAVATQDRESFARVLARMGATRENTDLITHHDTIRITRLD
jgi:hypothetical protein